MPEFEPTRRKFSIAIGSIVGIPLAGCSEASDDDEEPTDEPAGPGTDEPTETAPPTDTPTATETEEPTETPTPEPSEVTLTVMVYSASGANPPLEDATVIVDGEEVGQTDLDGVVETTVLSGEHTVAAQAVGMNGDEQDIEVEDEDVEVEFELEPVPEDGEASLELWPQNEYGDYVDYGYDITIHHVDNYELIERSYIGHFDETEFAGEEYDYAALRLPTNVPQVHYAGEYTVSFEPNEVNDFEPVEVSVEFTQEELENGEGQERPVVLDGALSSEELALREAITIDGEEHHLDANHDPSDTQWAFTSQGDGEVVDQQEWAGSDDQLWRFELVDEEEKLHRVVSVENEDLVWTVLQDEEEFGTPTYTMLQLGEWEESDKQLFRVTPIDPALDPEAEEGQELYKIQCPAVGMEATKEIAHTSGPCYGPSGGELEPDTPIISWWYAASPDQQVFLSPHE